MSEEQKPEGEGTTPKPEGEEEKKEEDSTESSNVSKVDEAKELLKKIEEANEKTKEWVERAERVKADSIIAGDSEAGQERPKPKTQEEQDDEKTIDTIGSALGINLKEE